ADGIRDYKVTGVQTCALPIFHELAEENFLIAGEPRSDFVRVVIDHIARRFEDLPNHMEFPEGTDLPALWRDVVATVLKPYVGDRSEERRVGKSGDRGAGRCV